MNMLISVLLGAMLAVPVGDRKEAPKDQDRLQGVWKATAAVSRGNAIPVDRFKLPEYDFVIVGDGYCFMSHAGTFMLDQAKGTVDFDVKAGLYKGSAILGRYELKDDTLTLTIPTAARNPMRPPELKPGADQAFVVFTLQRDAKATKDQAAALLKDRTAALPDKGIGGFGANPIAGGKGGFGGGGKAVAMPAATQQLLERILERLERIEQRLDAMEKKLAGPKEQK